MASVSASKGSLPRAPAASISTNVKRNLVARLQFVRIHREGFIVSARVGMLARHLVCHAKVWNFLFSFTIYAFIVICFSTL